MDVSQLSVTYLPPATEIRPVDGRKYTLMQSLSTGEWFLNIGYSYHANHENIKFRLWNSSPIFECSHAAD
ncbi:staygreen family protein [Bacillus sp. JJ1474]|uniref:staygreen family protein n=1 Tax=Bacillus sp. JJ1474 TaxID=3122955 RepID=UPI002FFE7AB5